MGLFFSLYVLATYLCDDILLYCFLMSIRDACAPCICHEVDFGLVWLAKRGNGSLPLKLFFLAALNRLLFL